MSAFSGLRALVTGASSGIGADLARELAAAGAHLVITARRAGPLDALAAELRAAHGVRVDVITADLGAPEAAHALWHTARAHGPVDVLVNNAGFGTFRPFGQTPWARDLELLQLNVVSLVELCHLFVAACAGRTAPAYLLNVASTAAFQGVPNMASYAATKAYVLSFTEALAAEHRGGPLAVSCLCPGGTVTAFHAMAGAGDYGRLANASMLSSRAVARAALAGLRRRRRVIVPGALNRLGVWGVRLAPRAVATAFAGWVMGAPRPGALPARAPGDAPPPSADQPDPP